MKERIHHFFGEEYSLVWGGVGALVILLAIVVALFWYNGEVAVAPEDVMSGDEEDSAEEISEGINNTPFPLSVPDGFELSVYAEVPEARVIVRDGFGNFWVSQTSLGQVSTIDVQSGDEPQANAVFRNLNNPHGLAIDPGNDTLLYIAEEHRISRVPLYSDGPLEEIASLPEGGGHFTRTIAFGPDERLYVSIGSSCNACEETDERRAAIYSMNPDGSDFRRHASGLRNAVFFDWSYVDGSMWATEMGRDNLGDNVPPDEINVIEEGGWYGWPWFYGKNVFDEQFRPGVMPGFAQESIGSHIDIQAHSAPLGLAFVPEEGWAQEYWYDLLVAYHGSWNRTEPTGYKLVRMQLDEEGNYGGTVDFITGWLGSNGTVYGRPVDILVYPEGEAFITDDEAGLVYRLQRISEV